MGKLVITGGAGFIGSNLAKKAQQNGWDVRILDDFSTSIRMVAEELESLGIEVIIGDIRDKSLVHSTILKSTAVVHLAAQVSVPLSVENPEETMEINVRLFARSRAVWLARWAHNPKVDGSNPFSATI